MAATCKRKIKVSSFHLKLTKVSCYMYPQQKQEIWLVVYSRSNLIGGPYIHLPLTHWAAHNIPQMHWLQCGFFTKKKLKNLSWIVAQQFLISQQLMLSSWQLATSVLFWIKGFYSRWVIYNLAGTTVFNSHNYIIIVVPFLMQ